MDKILGHLISLTKNIWLIKPENELSNQHQFTPGKRKTFELSGIVISLWYTKKAFKIIENISFIIIKDYEEFSNCDYESIKEIIKNVFAEICVDNRIFNPDEVYFSGLTRKGKDTLFSCKKEANIKLFSSIIADELFFKIRISIAKWCIIYAAPRISGDSFYIETEGLTILNKSDRETWNSLVAKGYSTNNWSPISGMYFETHTTPFSNYQYEYLFISEQLGTQKGSNFSTSLKLKKLFSVIFSIIGIKSNYRLHRCGADPYSICLQFSSQSSRLGIYMNEIGTLLPYYLENHVLNESDILKIQEWYVLESELSNDAKNRIEKSAHFINHAMNSKDIESYINYFISLDAIFGKKGAVEVSIFNGINTLPSCNEWKDKFSWLFQLRNELVHGGSRYIQEWDKYYNYYRHFGSEPEADLKILAFTCLYHAPTLLVNKNIY